MAPGYNWKIKIYLCSKQSSLFSFHAEPSSGKLKVTLVHLAASKAMYYNSMQFWVGLEPVASQFQAYCANRSAN